MKARLYFYVFICLLKVDVAILQKKLLCECALWVTLCMVDCIPSCGCFELRFVCEGVYVGVRLLYYIDQDLFRLGFNSPKGDSSLVIELSLDFDVEKYFIIQSCNHFKVLLPKQDNGIFFITINPKTKTHTLQIIKYL
jgi:hypothetical protein